MEYPDLQKANTALVTAHNEKVVNRYNIAPHGPDPEEEGADGGLIEYLRIARRNSKTIILASLAGLAIGFAIGIPMKPVFRATTSLEILTINEDFLNMKQASPTTTSDNTYETSEEQTQAKLLTSPSLIRRVISKLNPDATDHERPKMAQVGWRAWLHLPEAVEASGTENLLARAASSVKVKPTARTRILEVTVDSTDRNLAMNFANTLTREFMAQNMEARWSITHGTSEWLRRELEDARNKLRQSEDALQNYARNSGLIFTDDSTNVATEKLQQFQQSLSSSISDRISKQSRYELAQNAPPDSLADVLNDGALRETQSKINDLRRQIADLSSVYEPGYTKVRRLQAELDSLQLAFNQQRTDILTRIKNDYTEAERREKLLSLAYKSQAQEVTGQDEKAIQYNILKRDVDSNRQLYDSMLQQMKQASIASAMRASNVRVVDPAVLPTNPVSPNFKLNSAIGLFCGIFFSIVFVTIRERADRTLQQPGDIRIWLELPELGTIPNSSDETRRLAYRRQTRLIPKENRPFQSATEATQPNGRGNNPPSTDSIELVTLQKKPSLIAEAFRSVLTSILFIGSNGYCPRVLVFTSANPADGKTTITSNLAIAAAEIRLKVLVIDADLRRPRMHNIFRVSNATGLADLLQGDITEDLITVAIQQAAGTNIQVLPAGTPSNSAAHLLYSPNFAEMLSSLRKKYDLILIDTPPMLQMTDARVVSRLADAVVLVARSGKTTRDSLTAARDRLKEDQTTIMGTVLNDWNPKLSPGGYYGYYQSRAYDVTYGEKSK